MGKINFSLMYRNDMLRRQNTINYCIKMCGTNVTEVWKLYIEITGCNKRTAFNDIANYEKYMGIKLLRTNKE